MSWWDTSNFSNLASQAFKNAQKKIDKVLDIDEENKSKRKSSTVQKAAKNVEESEKEEKDKETENGDFWSTWMGSGSKSSSSSDSEKNTSVPASWSLPWGSGSQETNTTHTAKGDGDGASRSEQPSEFSERSITPKDSKLISSKKNNAQSPEQELAYDEGKWVGDVEDFATETKTEKVEEVVMKYDDKIDITAGVDFQYPELIAVEDDGGKQAETVQTPELKIAEGDILLQRESNLFSSAETTSHETSQNAESFVPKHNMDIQESFVTGSSPSGWDISDSVIKLVETGENDDNEINDFNSENRESIYSNADSGENVDNVLVSGVVCDKEFPVEEPNIAAELLPSDKAYAVSGGVAIPLNEENVQETLVTDKGDEEEMIMAFSSLKKEGVIGEECTTVQSGDEESDSQTGGLIQGYVNLPSMPKESHLKQGDDRCLSDLELATSATSSEFEVAVGPASSTGSSDTGRLDSSADTVVDKTLQEVEREDQYSLFGGGKREEDADKVHHTTIEDTVSPASSYVKCMLEEAMEESNKEDSSSDNHSNGSKSESSKLDSECEKSVYSGQESSDDIETTTSSDIEIISAPGVGLHDKQFSSGFELPQLKISVRQRSSGGDRHGHQRSDSQSSSSTHSKGGDHDELSPERGEVHTWRDEELQHPDLEAVQEEGADSPYHPERLLKKLAEMAEVLQARETKLVSMSKDNHRLMEDAAILRSQLQQSEQAREAETEDIKALTDEFAVRIGESEKKLQAAIREKESVKQQLSFTQSELEKRSQNSDFEVLLEEKTEQVQELLAEGEKLSKQQLQSNTIIKKLRAKEKENDTTLASQKKKIEEQKAELDRLKTVLDSKEDMESKQADAINQLNAAVQKQEQDYAKVLSDLEDAQEKNRGLQTALDNAYKEISELHRSNASQDSKAQEAALSKETYLREELKRTLEREQKQFRQEREAFIMQADDLRMDMAKLEKEHSRREDLLREEIAHLQERLQQDEARNQDVSQSITSATRPLLRQIENLQATYGAQSTAWEKVEKNLTDRLAEAQIALAMAQDKERTACESEMELKAKTTSLESANARLKQEKAQLTAHREADQLRLEELQDARNSFIAQLETSKQNLSHDLTQLKMEKVQLESQLTLERNKLENEKKKAVALEEQLRIMEKERPKSRGTPSPSPSMSISRQESLMGSFYERNSPGMSLSFSEDLVDNGSEGKPASKTSVYESMRHSGATVMMENLQSQLKLKEGEVIHLQNEIGQLERTRESMARELVNLSNQIEELKETQYKFEQLEEEHTNLNNRYSAILLMYGEKEEQVQELRLDIQDMKEMYKTQIDALLAK